MNNVVGVLSVITELKNPKVEKESGQFPSRLRLTADTCDSLKENIESGNIQVLVEKFNNEYQEVRQAIISAETEAAEQQVRADVMAEEKAQQALEKEKALELAKIRYDQTIARASSVEVVVPKITRLNVELSSHGSIFRKSDSGVVASTVSGMIPKALMVPGNFSKIYGKIGKNVSLYKLADKIKEPQQNLASPSQVNSSVASVNSTAVPVQPVANWHSIFDGVATEDTSLQIVANVNDRKEEVELVIPEQRGITSEELADRKVKAQIGDELADIRRLREGIAGTTPFNSGLVERENSLLQMLSEITGIDVETKKVFEQKQPGVTEFQQMVDSLIGYRDPITPEEHSIKAEELEAYYSDPQVVETMWELQMKNRLYDMNKPEAHEVISAAERVDNEKRAAMSGAIEILDSDDAVTVEKSSLVSSFDDKVLLDGAREQAEVLYERNVQADLINGAEEQAKALYERNVQADLVNGAEEQARALYERNVQADLVDNEVEQVKVLDDNVQTDLINGAEEQARALHERNVQADLVNGAEEQARALHEKNVQADLVNGAEEQARALHERNVQADLVNGAEEQARVLYERNVQADLVNGAEEQARALHERNIQADLVNGAEEQAKALYERNVQADLVNGAEEQARMLRDAMSLDYDRPVINNSSFYNDGNNVFGKTGMENPVEPKIDIPVVNELDKPYVITDLVPRYIDMDAPSKPIKLNFAQIGRLRSNSQKELSSEMKDADANVRDILMSLRTQLDELNVGVDQNDELERPFSFI